MKTSTAHPQVPQSAQRETAGKGEDESSVSAVVFVISNILFFEFYTETY